MKASNFWHHFVDKKGHVITNHHVIKDYENKAKIFYENENIKLKHVASDETLDPPVKANVKNMIL